MLAFVLPSYAATVKQYKSDKLTSNTVTCILQDRKGYIWIGTERGLNKFDGYHFTNYLHSDKEKSSIPDNTIVSMKMDRNGNLLIGTNIGVCRYNYHRDDFETFTTKSGEKPRISSIIELRNGTLLAGSQGYGTYKIDNRQNLLTYCVSQSSAKTASYSTNLYEDRYGNIWKSGNDDILVRYSMKSSKLIKRRIYTSPMGNIVKFITAPDKDMIIVCQHGLLQYDAATDRIFPADVQQLAAGIFVNSASTDHRGNLYLGTIGNGLFTMSLHSNLYQRYEVANIDFSFNNADVKFIFEDKSKNMWIGCNNKGILFVPNEKTQFSSWSFSSQNYHIGNAITSMVDAGNGYVWCTVTKDGAYLFDKNGTIVKHASTPENTDIIYRDHQGNYWVGAYDQLYRYSPSTDSWTLAAKLSGYMIHYMADNGDGKLYISTFSKGLSVYDTETGHVTNYNMYQRDKRRGNLCNDWVTSLYFDSKGLLWIGTTAGAACLQPKTGSFMTYGWMSALNQTSVNAFCEWRGNIVIGSSNGLYLFSRSSRQVTPFPGADVLRNQSICSCHTTKNSDLWLSTSMGLWQYKYSSKKWTSFINGNGLNAREYLTGLGFDAADGRIYVATGEGLTTFYPNEIDKNSRHIQPPMLTNLLIGGKSVNCNSLSNGEIITKSPVDESDHFTISYLDNTFSMEFSILDYSHSDNIYYEYRFNTTDEWSRTEEGKNSILFSHLQSGSYTLQVRACDGGSYSAVKTFFITVTPPWYSSAYAYITYIILFLLFTAYALYVYNRRRHEEVYEEKMKFLINATHDIRSPLTLILSPLKKMMSRDYDKETNEELDVINHNAQRILKLVNQILDIRKFDKHQMQLHCQDTSMVPFIEELCRNYDYFAKEYNVNFVFEHSQDDIHAWVDRINFDKVISNLLSNAFKYINDDGEIKVMLSTHHEASQSKLFPDGYVEIQVMDNGIGLPDTNTEKIFDRFYQSTNQVNNGVQGTGIGLNLCKMIVDMHHGSITAANRTDSSGTCFTVRIPLGANHLSVDEISNSSEIKSQNVIKTQGTQRFKILVVDDDTELTKYISQELSIYFRFTLCNNGKEALDELLNSKYDLVISDVVMPVMDGLELVKRIKRNTNISHIPVILLTSQSDIGNRLEGISMGADAYLAKPFDMEELRVTASNLIRNMQRLQGKFSGALKQEERLEEKEVDSNNDQLMNRVMKSINENMSDSEFSVEQLASEVGLSRSHLHRKMKEITGISASEFIRNLRVEQAAKLIRENKINITQVAYAVGFSSEAHFSTVFRKHFGSSPTEYQKRQEQERNNPKHEKE